MHSTNYADNQVRSFKTRTHTNSNNNSIFDVIRRLMFDGTPYNGHFCYQFTLNVKGMPDNVFHTPFNVKSKIQNMFKSNNLYIYMLCFVVFVMMMF